MSQTHLLASRETTAKMCRARGRSFTVTERPAGNVLASYLPETIPKGSKRTPRDPTEAPYSARFELDRPLFTPRGGGGGGHRFNPCRIHHFILILPRLAAHRACHLRRYRPRNPSFEPSNPRAEYLRDWVAEAVKKSARPRRSLSCRGSAQSDFGLKRERVWTSGDQNHQRVRSSRSSPPTASPASVPRLKPAGTPAHGRSRRARMACP